MEHMGKAGEGEVDFSSSFLSPSLSDWAGRVGIYVCLSPLPFSLKLERNRIFLQHYLCVR